MLTIIEAIIVFSLFGVLIYWLELIHCTKAQRKHDEYWERAGEKPFIDFCAHLQR